MPIMQQVERSIAFYQVTLEFIPHVLKDMGLGEFDGEKGQKALAATREYLTQIINGHNNDFEYYDAQVFIDDLEIQAGAFYSGYLSCLEGKILNK